LARRLTVELRTLKQGPAAIVGLYRAFRFTKGDVQSAEENDVSGTRISNYTNSQSDRVKKQCTL
jgi:hypothetical protein